MAKASMFKEPAQPPAPVSDTAADFAPAPPPAAAPSPPVAALNRYLVELRCPTPLAHPSLEVEAANEDEARAQFCEKNGISGSTQNWSVRKL